MFNEGGGKGEPSVPFEEELPVFWKKIQFQHSRHRKMNKGFYNGNDNICDRFVRFIYYNFWKVI